MNLSFAGCGFLGIYHVGVAVCFKKYAPHLLLDKISGASAGSLAAACLLCDLPLGAMTSDFFRVVNEARRHSLGPFSPSFSIQSCLFEGLQKHLPPDVHKRVNGRLHISLTRVYDGQNVIVSQFTSREDVLQALLCACFIPGFSGILPPRFRGVRYMDGGFSDNLPILDENTVTVSPFCGESDICPRDQSSQLFHVNWANTSIEISKQNINRFVRILFPPRPEFLSKLCQQGFDDALQYLQRNNLINCTKCVAIQSTFIVSETVPESGQDFDPECKECKKHRKDALIGNMPETVLNVIQSYLDSANKGLYNWLFKHKSIKLLALPATVPVDFLSATISKVVILAPVISTHLRQVMKVVIYEINDVIRSKLRQITKMQSQFSLLERRYNLKSSRSKGSRLSMISTDGLTRLKEVLAGQSGNDVDTFDHVLKMTKQHDAMYAYYYLDENDRMRLTKIFDVSDDDIFPIEASSYVDPYSCKYDIDTDCIWDPASDQTFGIISQDNCSSPIFEANNNRLDGIKADNPSDNSDAIGSDFSDPEDDRYPIENPTNPTTITIEN